MRKPHPPRSLRRSVDCALTARYWFHLSAVFLPCPALLARTLVTSCGVRASKSFSWVFGISPCERRAEKLLPKRCILRKKRFTVSNLMFVSPAPFRSKQADPGSQFFRDRHPCKRGDSRQRRSLTRGTTAAWRPPITGAREREHQGGCQAPSAAS